MLLMREMLNKAGLCVAVRVGRPQSAARLQQFADPQALVTHLRATTYLLGKEIEAPRPPHRSAVPLRDPVAPESLAAEVAALPAAAQLASMGSYAVYVSRAGQIPHLMQEIGRLREQSFRAVGEGTGRCADIDLHDDCYEQLFVWDSRASAVVGGYRLGRSDELRARFGNRGLYLTSLFEFREPFFRLLGPSLELGRSFVSVGYQRGYAPLLLLWRGICEYVARHPRYARLIGPASLSNDYDPVSRALVVRALRAHWHDPVLGALVRPRAPFAAHLSLGSLFGNRRRPPDLDALDALLAGREANGKGLPVLLRQYLKLGARVLAFNVDPAFGHSIDCLITLDLRRVPPGQLRKYMSDESMKRCTAFWGRPRGSVSRA
jgi:putative hemolysin